jgi:hypothetical protein
VTLWSVILLSSVIVAALKVLGYLVPSRILEQPTPSRIANLVTVALLSGLVVLQTIGAGMAVQLDARIPALGLAALLLWARAPFIVVVVAAAVTAALIRAFV